MSEKKEKSVEDRVTELEKTVAAAHALIRRILASLEIQFGVDINRDGKIGRVPIALLVGLLGLSLMASAFAASPVWNVSSSENGTCEVNTGSGSMTLTVDAISNNVGKLFVSNVTVKGAVTLSGSIGGTLSSLTASNLSVYGAITMQNEGAISGANSALTVSNIAANGSLTMSKAGAISAANSAATFTSVVVKGTALTANNAALGASNTTVYGSLTMSGGGAVAAGNSAVAASNATVYGSLTLNGGGAIAADNSAAAFSNTTFRGTLTGVGGGAISAPLSALTVTNLTIPLGGLADNIVTNADLCTGIDAAKVADGTVSSAEYQYIGTLSGNAQDQITANATAITNISAFFPVDTRTTAAFSWTADGTTWSFQVVSGVITGVLNHTP